MIKGPYIELLSDMERSIKWYEDNGLKTVVNNGNGFAMLEAASGAKFFINLAMGEIKRNQYFHGGQHEVVGFIVDRNDMEAQHKIIKDNGVEVGDIQYAHDDDGRPWCFYLNDPDDNKICVWRA